MEATCRYNSSVRSRRLNYTLAGTLLVACVHGQYGPAIWLSSLAAGEVNESSGLASSTRYSGIFWTHNDSGGGNALYAFDRKGRSVVRLTVSGRSNVDWEDMAEGPDNQLWVGDFGNNSLTRSNLAVYRLTEPTFNPEGAAQNLSATATRYPFSYPDGAHDAESLLVHPSTGEVFVVTKENSGVSGVYRFPQPMVADLPVVLEQVATVSFSSPLSLGKRTTGGDISADGTRLVIRTYLEAHEWRMMPGQSVASVLTGPRQSNSLLFSQGESIAYGWGGFDLYFTSEGVPCPLGMRALLRRKNWP